MESVGGQVRQDEWLEQWSIFDRNETLFLFLDWIYPQTLEDCEGKDVLEAGCGGGPHTELLARYAKHVTAVDLNTIPLARQRLAQAKNVDFKEADISIMDLGRQFDIVLCIAVIHHTDDPDRTAQNLKRHVKPGGKIILWGYSKEGNGMVEYGVEPLRKLFLKNLNRKTILAISWVITVLLYIPVYSVYLLPLKFLPYYEYFGNFRKLAFQRNLLNVFDKLNAPQVDFLTEKRVRNWFKDDDFEITHISRYKGVSWRITAQRRK